MNQTKDLKFAVLIDADNVPYSNIKGILEEIAKYGTPTFKRIYADWTKPTVSGWKGVLLENAINPVQQYSFLKLLNQGTIKKQHQIIKRRKDFIKKELIGPIKEKVRKLQRNRQFVY